MAKLSAADLYVIQTVLRRSLQVADIGQTFKHETRMRVFNLVLELMSEIEVEIRTDKPSPILLSSDSGVV
jgi:hypothetical protein